MIDSLLSLTFAKAKPAAARRRSSQENDDIELLQEDSEVWKRLLCLSLSHACLILKSGSSPERGQSQRRKQNGTKRGKSQSQGDLDEFEPPSGKAGAKRLNVTPQQMDDIVGRMVRYILFCDANKQTIKRADLGSKAIEDAYQDQKRHLLPAALQQAREKLRTVFGAELVEHKRRDKKKGTQGCMR